MIKTFASLTISRGYYRVREWCAMALLAIIQSVLVMVLNFKRENVNDFNLEKVVVVFDKLKNRVYPID